MKKIVLTFIAMGTFAIVSCQKEKEKEEHSCVCREFVADIENPTKKTTEIINDTKENAEKTCSDKDTSVVLNGITKETRCKIE